MQAGNLQRLEGAMQHRNKAAGASMGPTEGMSRVQVGNLQRLDAAMQHRNNGPSHREKVFIHDLHGPHEPPGQRVHQPKIPCRASTKSFFFIKNQGDVALVIRTLLEYVVLASVS